MFIQEMDKISHWFGLISKSHSPQHSPHITIVTNCDTKIVTNCAITPWSRDISMNAWSKVIIPLSNQVLHMSNRVKPGFYRVQPRHNDSLLAIPRILTAVCDWMKEKFYLF